MPGTAMQQKQYDYHRNCNLPQSNPALSPGRLRPYAFLTAPLSGCVLQSLLFPTHGSTVISRFPTNRSHRLFSAKRFYRIVRTAEGQLPDSDNIASGPITSILYTNAYSSFPSFLLYRVENDSCVIPGCSSSGLLSSGWRLQVRTNLKTSPGRSVSGSVLTLQTTSSIFSAGSTQTFIVEQVRIFPPVMARTEGRVTQPAFLKRTM